MNYAELVRQAVNKMDLLAKTAKEESRALTDEENEVFNKLSTDIENWEKASEDAAKREAKILDIQNRLNTPENKDLPLPKEKVKVGNNREASKPWNSHGEFFLAVRNATLTNQVDPRLFNMPSNASGMQVSVGGDGGFMVGADNESWLMNSVNAESQIYSRIEKMPIGAERNSISLPALAETSRATGSRFGGVVGYWSAEAATATKSKPVIRNVDIKLEKLLAFCYMTEELMQDARSLEAFVNKAFGAEFSFLLDDAIINADGNGKPLGILNSPALVSVAKEVGQAADTIVAENIVKMHSRLGARNRKNAVWLINQEIEPELHTMTIAVGTGGVPLYMPANGLSGLPYSTLMGKPVLPVEQCSKLGDKGDIILCDLKDYIGIDKGGLEGDSSIHVQFLYDETAFRFRYRFNGTPYTVSPLASKANSSFTTSPYVTLAAR